MSTISPYMQSLMGFGPGSAGINYAPTGNNFGGGMNYSMPQNFGPATGIPNIEPNVTPQTQNQGNGFMNLMFGNSETGQNGMAVPIAQSIAGLAGSYMGMKQYGLAKEAFKESKRQFQLNFDAQKKDYNNQLEDRQRARIASSGDGGSRYQSVSEIMKKRGL